MKKKKILILGGGISREREISLQTAKSVYKELKKKNYKVIISEPDENLINKIKNFRPNVVFNALHGQFGEDGYMQALLEAQKVKYTHSGVLASFNAMDKEISKKIYTKNKILTPKYIKFSYKNNNKMDKKIIKKIKKKLKFPVVIKPINEGSSVNVYICNSKNFLKNLKKLYFYKEILIEEFIGGREIQVAIMGNKKLGAIELKPKRKFYDYKAKYSKAAMTNHIMPANISAKSYNTVLRIAKKAHSVLKCRGVSRSDFKFYKNKFYLLEINTQPGMTSLSLVPEIAKYKGISFEKLVKSIIKDAGINK